MAKNTKQIALIQHRRGKLSELPMQLNESEFGLATDTNELFIGNPNNPALVERIESNIFPYGNIQVLTEFTENLKKITYTYKSNTDVTARLPIVIVGTEPYINVLPDTSVIINGVEIGFTYEVNLANIVKIINSQENLNVKAFIHNYSYLGLISTDTEIVIEDGKKFGNGCVKNFGFGDDSFYSASSSLPPERTLQSLLDDHFSIKNFGAYGNGIGDDSSAIYNAIVSINKAGEDAKYYRTIFFPAGTYRTSKQIPLPYGTYLKGEGIGRTIIKSFNTNTSIMSTMDSNFMCGSTSEYYGLNAKCASHVTVEDMTIDVSGNIASTLLLLSVCNNITFRNVEFIGDEITTLVRISDSINASNSSHIIFDGCIFNTGENAIKSFDNIEHLVVKNCKFNNIKNEAILLQPTEGKTILNSVIENNIFNDCSRLSDYIILLGDNTQYISVLNNKFDKEVTEYTSNTKPYITHSTLNYADIFDAKTSDKKILQYKFTQPVWEFIDYLINPNGEYLLQSHYNSKIVDGEEIIPSLTNGIILEQGDNTNNDTVSLVSSNTIKDLNVGGGAYGKLQLGKNIKSMEYDNWFTNQPYKKGERIAEYFDHSYIVYECLENHISSNSNDYTNENYWLKIGEFYPSITVNKEMDMNNNSIVNNVGNISFRTTNNNIITVNCSDSTIPYAERIPSYSDALTNVDYVNRIAQTTIRNTFDFGTIEVSPTNQQELIYFDPYTYGDFINMNNISINVRRPYYPLVKRINENTPEWRTGLRYYVGDVVKINEENPFVNEFEMSIANEDLEWIYYPYENILKPTEEELDGHRNPLETFGNDGDYACVIGTEEESYAKYLYEKIEGLWYMVGSDDWKYMFNTYAIGKPDKTYVESSIIMIDDIEIELTGTTVDEAVEQINVQFTDMNIVASNVNGALKIDKVRGKLVLKDVKFGALESLGFELNESTNEFVTLNTSFIKTINDDIPTSTKEHDIWIKVEPTPYYYACTKDNIASESFEEDAGFIATAEEIDAGLTEKISHWVEVYKQGVDINNDEVIDLPDVKYVSILATNEVDAKRLLFKRDAIDVSKRNINSMYEKNWVIGHDYKKGDRCLFNDRYYECLSDHTSVNQYELNTASLWLAIPEEGFNYKFDFERNIYKLDENNNIVNDDDFTVEYNFSGYSLYLEFYDENEKLIPVFKTLDDALAINNQVQVSPSGNISVTINYVRGSSSENTSNS